MKKPSLVLTCLAAALVLPIASGCGRSQTASASYRSVPVPQGAKLVYEGKRMGLSKNSWQGVFETKMPMSQVAKWYEKRMKAAKWKYVKSPEEPVVSGYTIFDIRDTRGGN